MLLTHHHDRGPAQHVGDFLRTVVTRDGHWVALSVLGPGALALEGKMIHVLISTISLEATEDGAPVAWAVIDQKEQTEYGELQGALRLLTRFPSFEG